MKSRPVYTELCLRSDAARHLFISGVDGAMAVRRVFDSTVWSGLHVDVLHWEPAGSSGAYGHLLEGIPGVAARMFATPDELGAFLDTLIAEAGTGTHVYISGPEMFMWDAAAVVRKRGVSLARISMELRGSIARTVICVHCKERNKAVSQSPHVCAGCGLSLLVRDHFSRFHRAYVGVRIDAETPGEIPPAEDLAA